VEPARRRPGSGGWRRSKRSRWRSAAGGAVRTAGTAAIWCGPPRSARRMCAGCSPPRRRRSRRARTGGSSSRWATSASAVPRPRPPCWSRTTGSAAAWVSACTGVLAGQAVAAGPPAGRRILMSWEEPPGSATVSTVIPGHLGCCHAHGAVGCTAGMANAGRPVAARQIAGSARFGLRQPIAAPEARGRRRPGAQRGRGPEPTGPDCTPAAPHRDCHRRPPVATRARRGQQSLGWGPVDERVRRDRRPVVGAQHRRDHCGCVGSQLGGNGCLRDGWLADHQFRHRSHCCLRLVPSGEGARGPGRIQARSRSQVWHESAWHESAPSDTNRLPA